MDYLTPQTSIDNIMACLIEATDHHQRALDASQRAEELMRQFRQRLYRRHRQSQTCPAQDAEALRRVTVA